MRSLLLLVCSGKIFCPSENGSVYVVEADFKVIATNKMDGPCLATPTISQGTRFIRSPSVSRQSEPTELATGGAVAIVEPRARRQLTSLRGCDFLVLATHCFCSAVRSGGFSLLFATNQKPKGFTTNLVFKNSQPQRDGSK